MVILTVVNIALSIAMLCPSLAREGQYRRMTRIKEGVGDMFDVLAAGENKGSFMAIISFCHCCFLSLRESKFSS